MSIELALRELVAQLVREELRRQAGSAQYLSTGHAAELADVAPGTIRRWLREGRLRGYRAGRAVRVKRDELEQLLRAGNENMTPEQLAARDFE
jgi:excisionase family DNA binding protein